MRRAQIPVFFILAFLTITIVSNCSLDKSNEQTQTVLSGRYINETFLQQLPDSIAGSIPSYCYELNFIADDSVRVFYGFEQGTLLYKNKSDGQFALLSAVGDNDIAFTLNSDSTITLHDSTWIGVPLNSKFKKVPDQSDSKWVFTQYLNERMITGHYLLHTDGQTIDNDVVFKANGELVGLLDYDSYAICFSGDCVNETALPNNIIYLYSNSGKRDSYVFKIDQNENKIAFHELTPPIFDAEGNPLKGGRTVGKLKFDLVKPAKN